MLSEDLHIHKVGVVEVERRRSDAAAGDAESTLEGGACTCVAALSTSSLQAVTV